MHNLEEYKNKNDKFDSLFTILIYDKSLKETISFIYDKLEKIKNISNSFTPMKI